MNAETQALVDRLRRPMHGKPGEADQWLRDDPTLIGEVVTALTALARDLETARQERDAALTRYGSTGASQGWAIVVRLNGPWVRYEDHRRIHAALVRERDAALRQLNDAKECAEDAALERRFND